MASLSTAISGLIDEVAGVFEPMQRSRSRRPPVTYVERGRRYELYRNGRRGPTLIGQGETARLGEQRLPREALARPVEVRLDRARMFSKVLQLPAASRDYLDAVVAHQLERATPWSADRVVFDYVLAQDAGTGPDQIAVRLVATSRDLLDGAVERLSAAGIKPAAVGTTDDPLDQPSPINLLQTSRGARREALRRKVALVLLAVLVLGVSGSAWAGWRLHRLSTEAAIVSAEIAQARATIEAARSRSEHSEAHQKLLAQKAASIPMVRLIEQLSATIPQTTHLTSLIIQGQELRLAGLSSDAPALIGILENTEELTDVHFAAPTVSGEGEAQDRFEILARITAPAGAPPEGADDAQGQAAAGDNVLSPGGELIR